MWHSSEYSGMFMFGTIHQYKKNFTLKSKIKIFGILKVTSLDEKKSCQIGSIKIKILSKMKH